MGYEVVKADAFKKGDKVTLGNGERGVVRQFVTSPTGFHSYRVAITEGPRAGSVVGATAPAMDKRASVTVGDRTFACRVATTPREHAQGLQDTPELAPNEGLLFAFEHARPAVFHMGRVTYPIDIMFVENGRVARVARGCQPGSRERWSHPRSEAVLEVAAGRAPHVGARVKTAAPRWPYGEKARTEEGYDLIDRGDLGCDWDAGGCYTFAAALQDRVGGDLYVVVDSQGVVRHYVVKKGDLYMDAKGAKSEEQLLRTWARDFDRPFVERYNPNRHQPSAHDIPHDPSIVPELQQLWDRDAMAPPLGEEPQRYKIEFPKNVTDPVPNPTERWKDRSTPDVSDPNANQMSNQFWREQLGYDTVDFHDDPHAPKFRPSAQRIDDPADLIVGLIEGMMREDPLSWAQDALNQEFAYAMITPTDIAEWISALDMTDGESTDVLDAVTSPEGMQILGDGFVLAGLGIIANVASTDEGPILVLWKEYED